MYCILITWIQNEAYEAAILNHVLFLDLTIIVLSKAICCIVN